jgi:hypothetical protein
MAIEHLYALRLPVPQILPRLHRCVVRELWKAVSGTKVNVLAAQGCLCVGIRQITFDKTRQKLGRGLYYIKHRSKSLDQLFMSETIETVVLRRSAQ